MNRLDNLVDSREHLKDCPNCGAEVRMEDVGTFYLIDCPHCPASMMHVSEIVLEKAWNRRHSTLKRVIWFFVAITVIIFLAYSMGFYWLLNFICVFFVLIVGMCISLIFD